MLWIEPGAAGSEASMLPLFYAERPPPPYANLFEVLHRKLLPPCQWAPNFRPLCVRPEAGTCPYCRRRPSAACWSSDRSFRQSRARNKVSVRSWFHSPACTGNNKLFDNRMNFHFLVCRQGFFKDGPFLTSFSLLTSFLMYNWLIKFDRCLGSNWWSLGSKATTLPTEPQPLAYL